MSKFRGIQIRDGAIQTVHFASGISVNGVTLSGTLLSQKTLSLVDSIGLNGLNVAYNLDNFFAVSGGTVTGSIVVVGSTTGTSSVSVVSGSSLSIHGLVTQSDLIQALAGAHSTVTSASLKRITDGSTVTSDHTHNFSALSGKEERELVKVATQSGDTISLDFGNYALISLPNLSTLKSSDIEAFINGQLLEYGSPNGFTLNSLDGTVTFHPSISGDTLAVLWRGLDTTASGVVVSYEPTEYPYPAGGGITTIEGLYANGGSPGDLYGGWSDPTASDDRADIHMKLVVSGVAGISRIDIKKDSNIVASTESGVGVPVKVFTGSINRTMPFMMDSSGSFVFDLYFTTPTGVSAGNLLTATYTTISGASVNTPGTGLPASGNAAQPQLSNISDIYSNVAKEIANISITSIPTPFGTTSAFPISGTVYFEGEGYSLPNLASYPSWLSNNSLNSSDWLKFKVKNVSGSSSYEGLRFTISSGTFSYSPAPSQFSTQSGVVAVSSSGTLIVSDSEFFNAAESGTVSLYSRRYINGHDLLSSGKVFLTFVSENLNGGYYINGSQWCNLFLIGKGAAYSSLSTLHFDDPFRIQSLTQLASPAAAHEIGPHSLDFCQVSKSLSQDVISSVALDHSVLSLRALAESVLSPNTDLSNLRPKQANEVESNAVDFSSLVV